MYGQSKNKTTLADFVGSQIVFSNAQGIANQQREERIPFNDRAYVKSLSAQRIAKNKRRSERKQQWKIDAEIRRNQVD